MKNKEVLKMCESAILVALAIVLDIAMKAIPFLNMPNGGHISLAGLVLAIMSFRNGLKYGLIGCFIFATINWMIDGYTTSPWSIILDYYVAFMIFGLCGLFTHVFDKISLINYAIFIVMLSVCHTIRFVSSTVSGVYAWDTPWKASAVYNGPYVYASLGVAIVVGCALIPGLVKLKERFNYESETDKEDNE